MNLTRILSNSLITSALSITSYSAIAADSGSLQQQIESLKAENEVIMQRLEATVDIIESGNLMSSTSHSSKSASSNKTFGDHGNTGSTTIGGYGELHYNNTDSTNQIDLHRFILFMGHEFSDKIRFWSELEVEHATADKNGGEVAMEQAFLEFDLNENNSIRTGIILVPVGLINETHEPPTFYGVERNNVEKYIIPSTWREGGVAMTGRFGGAFSYDVAMHSGLQISSGESYAVRSGRQAVREAPAQDPAYTARLKWMGIRGLELGGAVQYQRDITQGTDLTAGSATLLETHAVWSANAVSVRALYASWDLSGTGPKSIGADEQSGWYIEPSYKINPQFGIFARQSSWDNQANSSNDTENTQTDVGFSYWPHEDVVVKFDYQQRDKAGTNDDGFNLGVGYQF